MAGIKRMPLVFHFAKVYGAKVYTTDVIVDELEFCESKKAEATAEPTIEDISIEQAELPFK